MVKPLRIILLVTLISLGAAGTALAAPPIPPAPAPPPATPVWHCVRYGETLSGIAARYGTTISAIAAANGIVNPNRIYAGQCLVIPPRVAPAPLRVHIVQPGETLWRIAVRYGTTIYRLVALNGIANPNLIYSGQRLLVPAP